MALPTMASPTAHAQAALIESRPAAIGAVALARVQAVLLDVADVVHEVVGAGDHAEADEGDDRLEELPGPGVGIAEAVLLVDGEEQRHEDDAVFRPLAGAGCLQDITEMGEKARRAHLVEAVERW